jgi:tyrosine-protein phosphatase YwqE
MASSPILYLYANKYQPLEIYNKSQKIIPLANVANNYIYNGNYNNKPITIKTDNFGFFNEKKKKFINIFIGDSFVAGAEIDYTNNSQNSVEPFDIETSNSSEFLLSSNETTDNIKPTSQSSPLRYISQIPEQKRGRPKNY